jgi:2-isopropylmalate synthase
MSDTVVLYDTTLRDGTQQAGISLSVEDKLRIAARLITFGIPYIEGGWPGSNPKDLRFFEVAPATLDRTRLVAFGSTRRARVQPEADAQLATVASADVPTVALVGKASRFQVERVLRVDLPENLAMIRDSVRYLRERGRRVVFDAEHFFDGMAEDDGYSLACIEAALEAGADWVVLCDTNGGSLPSAVARATARVAARFPGARLGIHTHNDGGLAVANSLAAVEAGARMVQGTINGYGERCGNADLCQVIPALQLKMGFAVVPPERLEELVRLARFVAEVVNLPLPDSSPYVGVNAFTHKGGLHASGMERDARAYEHVRPEQVGAERRVVASELAGQATIRQALAGLELSPDETRALLKAVKDREEMGYRYEDAEASLTALALSLRGGEPPFRLVHYRAMVDGPEHRAEATAEVLVQGRVAHAAALGNGPVAALDEAMRRALKDFFPALERIHLVDYRVRVIDGTAGVRARVRVWVESTDGVRRWRTVGVSTDVVAASAEALVDAWWAGLTFAAAEAQAAVLPAAPSRDTSA